MAKKKTTTRKFYIVDLVRYKPKTKYLTIDPTRVDIEIDVTTTGIFTADEVPSAAMDRLEKAARDALDVYETTIASEVERLEKKISDLVDSGDPTLVKDAEALAQGVNVSIKNALASAEGAAKKAVEDRLAKEKQGDKNLKEAQFKLGFKIGVGVVRIVGNIGTLVASSGGDLHAYYAIAKSCYTIGKEIYEYNKGEVKLRKELESAIQAFLDLRGTVIQQAAQRQKLDTSGLSLSKPVDAMKEILTRVQTAGEEVLNGRNAKQVFLEVMDFTVKGIKSQLNDVDTARKAYREHVTKTRKKVDDLSVAADKLVKGMKAAASLKDGVKIGAKAMAAKRGVSEMAKKLDEREKHLDDVNELLKGNGLTIDDRTALQKIRALDISTILSEGKELSDALSEVKDMLEVFI